MKLKWFFTLLLCLSLGLCGCGEEVQVVPTTQAAGPMVGLCLRNVQDAPAYAQALEQTFTDAGFEVSIQDARNDQSVQDSQVQALAEDGCCLLVVEPVMVTAQESVIQTADSGNLPLILINYQPAQAVLESSQRLCYIGFDPAEAAQLQMDALQQLPQGGDLNEDGSVSIVVLTGPEDHKDTQLHLQAVSTVQSLELVHTDWSVEAGQAACARLLEQYGKDVEVILCGSDTLALGAVQAVEEGGWALGQDMYLLSMGNDPQVAALVQQGILSATISRDTDAQIAAILQAAQTFLQDGLPQKLQLIPHLTLTQE